jgi:hypothetical protein
MGIRFNCPNGHKLNVKEFLAGKRGVCPQCGAKFIIPTPAEGADMEVPQPVGVGLSQSVEIPVSPVPSQQVASTSASPSIIISVTDIDLAPPELGVPPEIRGTQIPVADALPASIVAVPTPIEAQPEVATTSQRERSRRNQIVISLLLLGLVVLLAGILIWVLNREVDKAPIEKKAAADRSEFNQVVAMTRVGALQP